MARIAIVDDDVECGQTTSAILVANGHETTLLHTMDKAVETLIQSKPDLLVLDVMFPDNPVAGFDLAREVRRHRELSGLPILMLSSVNKEFPMGFSASDIDSDWMPVQDFLDKPVKAAALLEAVDKLLTRVAQR